MVSERKDIVELLGEKTIATRILVQKVNSRRISQPRSIHNTQHNKQNRVTTNDYVTIIVLIDLTI